MTDDPSTIRYSIPANTHTPALAIQTDNLLSPSPQAASPYPGSSPQFSPRGRRNALLSPTAAFVRDTLSHQQKIVYANKTQKRSIQLPEMRLEVLEGWQINILYWLYYIALIVAIVTKVWSEYSLWNVDDLCSVQMEPFSSMPCTNVSVVGGQMIPMNAPPWVGLNQTKAPPANFSTTPTPSANFSTTPTPTSQEPIPSQSSNGNGAHNRKLLSSDPVAPGSDSSIRCLGDRCNVWRYKFNHLQYLNK
eukprot:PhF_6_TR10543/c0_g1_i2/m.16699